MHDQIQEKSQRRVTTNETFTHHTSKQGINGMQSRADIDGNVLFNDVHMANNPYKMPMEEWISPKDEYTFTKARTALVLKYTAKGHANIHHSGTMGDCNAIA